MKFVYRYASSDGVKEQLVESVSRAHADRLFVDLCGAMVDWRVPVVVHQWQPYSLVGRLCYLLNEGYALGYAYPEGCWHRASIRYEDRWRSYTEEVQVRCPEEWAAVVDLFRRINDGTMKNGESNDETN